MRATIYTHELQTALKENFFPKERPIQVSINQEKLINNLSTPFDILSPLDYIKDQ